MGRVEPGDDMHGTQRTFIQNGHPYSCRFLRWTLPRSLTAAGLGKITRDLFGIAATAQLSHHASRSTKVTGSQIGRTRAVSPSRSRSGPDGNKPFLWRIILAVYGGNL